MDGTSITVADSQYLIRLGIKHLLSRHAQFRIVSEAEDDEELAEQLPKQRPDVVILDYNQPTAFDRGSITRIKQLSPSTNILIISDDDDKDSIYQVLQSGVNSFLTKSCDEEEIIDAVKATAKGEKFFCTRILDYLLERTFASNTSSEAPQSEPEVSCKPTPLSPREIEIVQLIAQGMIAKEIASELNLSTHTIYTHRKNIMKKLKLSSASELVLYAVNMGLVKSDSSI
jgi:DNA-binding NarL/FixJ family response regulator